MPSPVTTTTTELPSSRVRVEAEVAATEVEQRMQQAARKLGNTLRVPGFRKGKVPPPVVIRRLGRDYVLDEALRQSLGGWYVDAIDASGIAPVGEPEINVGDLPEPGQPLSFSIEIGVRPLAELGTYRGLEVPRREAIASDEAIDAEVNRLRDRLATLDTVDRAAQLGDFVVMDYRGTLDGEPFDGGEGRDQLLELGSGRLIPGFEEQLVGAVAGEHRRVEVTFPEDYGSEELAGKPAVFEVQVGEVKAKSLPELDDDFAANAAGLDTLAELREDIARRLREYEEHAIGHEFERDVLDAVAEGAEIAVPPELVHARAHEIVEETIASLTRQGISKEMYLQIAGTSEEEMAGEAEPEAERSLRREAVIAAVVEAEQIEPTEEQLLEALEPTAERDKTTPEKLLKRFTDNGRIHRLRRELANRQAVQWLVEQATPTAAAPAPEGDAEPEASTAAEAEPTPAEPESPAADGTKSTPDAEAEPTSDAEAESTPDAGADEPSETAG